MSPDTHGCSPERQTTQSGRSEGRLPLPPGAVRLDAQATIEDIDSLTALIIQSDAAGSSRARVETEFAHLSDSSLPTRLPTENRGFTHPLAHPEDGS